MVVSRFGMVLSSLTLTHHSAAVAAPLDKRRMNVQRHGAKRNPYDESYAFGSEYEKTTDNLKLTNRRTFRDWSGHNRGVTS